MLLKSIKLENIRSYKTQEINFPLGSVLLSGDIGSGKSTILLAIEFALFGIRKPDLSGAALLRKGASHGSIELDFNIDNKEVKIKRTLKKTKDEIKQDAGFVIVNGTRMDGTPVELKAKIIDLLGYPKDLVTKHKDLIFRYTVYTPQEEMKAILFEDSDSRLNTIRKVFGIDKYKRIRENCLLYIRNIKTKKTELKGKIFDLLEKQNDFEKKETELSELNIKIEQLKPELESAKQKVIAKKTKLDQYIKQIEILIESKKQLAIYDATLKNKVEQRMQNTKQLKEYETQINDLRVQIEKDSNNIQEVSFTEVIKKMEEEIRIKEKKLQEIKDQFNELEFKKKLSNDIISKITKLDTCPTCEQNVTSEYKDKIKHRESNNLELISEQQQKLIDSRQKQNDLIQTLKKDLELLREKEKNQMITNIKLRGIAEKTKVVESIKVHQDQIKIEIGNINEKKIELNTKIKDLVLIEETYNKAKLELEELQLNERKIAIEFAGLDNTQKASQKYLAELKTEIELKLKLKEQISRLNNIQAWIEQYFMNLMVVLEKQVMGSLYCEFNECFVEWFSVLIDDETLTARLNDEFTPVIEQNGYEIELENLSGGEKTSVALSYRLALNKTINDYISHIKTRDIIILDEPTDGFSHEQLDRVRDLLESLKISQVIIVSHESKVESFVDNIIRISKRDHQSHVSEI